MGKFIIDTLNKEDIISAMDMLYGVCKEKYCYREELDLLKQKFEALQKEHTNLKSEKDKFEENLSQMKIDAEKVKEENVKLTKENNHLNEEILKIEQEYKGYKNRLIEIEITNNDSLDKTYYQVKDKYLEMTTSNKAPYIVTKNEFFFNDNGQHQNAIQHKERMLDPFCEIVSSTPDANYVKMLSKGKCQILETNTLKMRIVEKAKISLIHR